MKLRFDGCIYYLIYLKKKRMFKPLKDINCAQISQPFLMRYWYSAIWHQSFKIRKYSIKLSTQVYVNKNQ